MPHRLQPPAFNSRHRMKNCLCALGLVLSTGPALAQGTVHFDNLDAPITNILGLPIGTGFMVAFYYLPDQEILPTYDDFRRRGVTLPPSVHLIAGLFASGTRSTPALPGANAWFQACIWETAFGPTFEDAVSNPNPICGRLALAVYSEPEWARTGDPTATPPTPATRVGFY